MAQTEDNKLKKVAEVEAAEQRRLQEERERQDKEAKKQAKKETTIDSSARPNLAP